MATQQAKRPDNRARRHALNMKTTADLRYKLEDRAKISGRVLTHEVEQQLIRSFEMEEEIALQDEIKAEMRGTIAALEKRIFLIEEGERALWPDESAGALGKSFALALAAVQQVTGKPWREDAAAAPIIGAVVRRLMAENTRTGGSLFAELFDRERIDFLTDGIAKALAPSLREALPPLSGPAVEAAKLPRRARIVTTFRDRASQEVLRVAAGPEFDPADPEDRPQENPELRAAMDALRSRRALVDIAMSLSYTMDDGTTTWEALDKSAPPSTRPATPEEAAAFQTVDDPKRPAALFDGSDFADLGLEDVGGPDDGDGPPPPPAAPAPRRGRPRKVPA